VSNPTELKAAKESSLLNLLAVVAVGLGASVGPLDFAVNVAFPAISAAFQIQTQTIRWVALFYVMTYGSLVLWFGALGDRIGHLRVFRFGLVLGAIAFTLCAVSPFYSWLLAARVLQGISAALILSCGPALVTFLYAESERTRALSMYGSMAGLATVAAPLIGGFSIAWMGWTGVYWIRVPIVLVALACLAIHNPRLQHRAHGQPDATQKTESLSTLRLLLNTFNSNSNFGWVNASCVIIQLCSFSIPLILPYYLIRVLHWGSAPSGALLVSWAVGGLIGAAVTTPLVRRFGMNQTGFIAAGLCCIGLVAVSLWSASVSVLWMVISIAIQGAGLGLFQVVYSDWMMADLPPQSRGVAGSLAVLTRMLGIVTGAVGWLWLVDSGEAGALAAGSTPEAAFLAGYQQLHYVVAGVSVGFFALSCFKRGLWFRTASSP
jgi:MFS family permease